MIICHSKLVNNKICKSFTQMLHNDNRSAHSTVFTFLFQDFRLNLEQALCRKRLDLQLDHIVISFTASCNEYVCDITDITSVVLYSIYTLHSQRAVSVIFCTYHFTLGTREIVKAVIVKHCNLQGYCGRSNHSCSRNLRTLPFIPAEDQLTTWAQWVERLEGIQREF